MYIVENKEYNFSIVTSSDWCELNELQKTGESDYKPCKYWFRHDITELESGHESVMFTKLPK